MALFGTELVVALPADEAVLGMWSESAFWADPEAGAAAGGLEEERLEKTFWGLCLILVR